MTTENPSPSTLSNKSYRFDYVSAMLMQFSLYYCRAKSFIYDVLILRMTEKWYRSVLERMEDGSLVLDVGVGTGSALLRCIDIIQSKNLRIIGIDIDAAYVEVGKDAIQKAGLGDRISIDKIDVYEDSEKIINLAKTLGASMDTESKCIDAVYFSGSFSLLPDPVKALTLVAKLVKAKHGNKGTIYITQTYQRQTPFFLPYVKPLLKYVTTIDFGHLVSETDILKTFRESGLEVVEHSTIKGSVDTRFQAAYLSVLC